MQVIVVLFYHPGGFFIMVMCFFLEAKDGARGGSLALLVPFFGFMSPLSEPDLFHSALASAPPAIIIFGGFPVVIHFVEPEYLSF